MAKREPDLTHRWSLKMDYTSGTMTFRLRCGKCFIEIGTCFGMSGGDDVNLRLLGERMIGVVGQANSLVCNDDH